MNPELDLSIERIIRAPRAAIWDAWTNPDSLGKWFMPAPLHCKVDRLDVTPGGVMVTQLSEDGATFFPHVQACFLVVEPRERLVFTNAVDSEWRPATPQPVAMTAEITLRDHPDGTDYRVIVRHGDPAARAHHEEVGFFDGWGAVTDQLAALAESAGT